MICLTVKKIGMEWVPQNQYYRSLHSGVSREGKKNNDNPAAYSGRFHF